jgi:hypothetical protein
VTVIVVSPSGQPGGTTTVMMVPSLLTMATGSPHMVTVAPVRLVPTIWMVAPGRTGWIVWIVVLLLISSRSFGPATASATSGPTPNRPQAEPAPA